MPRTGTALDSLVLIHRAADLAVLEPAEEHPAVLGPAVARTHTLDDGERDGVRHRVAREQCPHGSRVRLDVLGEPPTHQRGGPSAARCLMSAAVNAPA